MAWLKVTHCRKNGIYSILTPNHQPSFTLKSTREKSETLNTSSFLTPELHWGSEQRSSCPEAQGPQVDKQELHPLQETFIRTWNTHLTPKPHLSASWKLQRTRPTWPSRPGKQRHSSQKCQVRQNKPPTHTQGKGFLFNKTKFTSTRALFLPMQRESEQHLCHLHLLHYQEHTSSNGFIYMSRTISISTLKLSCHNYVHRNHTLYIYIYKSGHRAALDSI